MRKAEIARKTAETDIKLALDLDGRGIGEIETGVGFLDHMLTLFSRHARVDLTVSCAGDTRVDDHHSVEDVGICLGLALRDALGEKRGIARYGDVTLPMDPGSGNPGRPGCGSTHPGHQARGPGSLARRL
jgi:imidazoleglycerol-phosphate dehydratase